MIEEFRTPREGARGQLTICGIDNKVCNTGKVTLVLATQGSTNMEVLDLPDAGAPSHSSSCGGDHQT